VSGIRLQASEDCAVVDWIDLGPLSHNNLHHVPLNLVVVGLISWEVLPLVDCSRRISLVQIRHLVCRHSIDSVENLLDRMLEPPGFCLSRALSNVGGFVVTRVHFDILRRYSYTVSYSSGSSMLYS